MSLRYITVPLLALVLLAPAAAADHIHEVQQVETEETDEVDTLYLVVEGHTDPMHEVGALYQDFICPVITGFCLPGQYDTAANVQVWEESNGCDGLQERSTDCDGDGDYEPRDTHHETVGCTPGISLCSSPVWVTP